VQQLHDQNEVPCLVFHSRFLEVDEYNVILVNRLFMAVDIISLPWPIKIISSFILKKNLQLLFQYLLYPHFIFWCV